MEYKGKQRKHGVWRSWRTVLRAPDGTWDAAFFTVCFDGTWEAAFFTVCFACDTIHSPCDLSCC